MVGLKPERLSLEDCADQPVSICGKSFLAHKSGALYWPAERALIVADLHLEKGSSFAAAGQMLPPYDTRETLTKLATAIDFYRAETIIAVGDSLHDAAAAGRFCVRDYEALRILQEDRDWIWITGNHDPEIDRRLGGFALPQLTVEGLTFRHRTASRCGYTRNRCAHASRRALGDEWRFAAPPLLRWQRAAAYFAGVRSVRRRIEHS